MTHDQFNHFSLIDSAYKRINSSFVSTEKSLVGDYWIAHSGALIAIPFSLKKIFIGGYSCKNDIHEAIKTAQYETLERVLSTYNFCHPKNRAEYEIISFSNRQIAGKISAQKIILGPTPLCHNNATDATGLSFHIEKELAIEHAIHELLERSILGMIWYKSCKIFRIEETTHGNFTITSYSLFLSNRLIPFVMSIAYSNEHKFLCAGASFSKNITLAKEKATEEACMLAHDILTKKNNDHILNPKTKKRMLTQTQVDYISSRKSHLDKISVEAETRLPNYFEYNLDDYLKIFNLNRSDVGYCMIQDLKDKFIVRAVVPKLKSLRYYRDSNENEYFDPMC